MSLLAPETALRLAWAPEVYLASSPQAEPGIGDFLRAKFGPEHGWESDAKDDGDYLPEVAGRVCYQSFTSPRPGGNAAYLQHIKEVKHASVFEHSNFGLILAGVSRNLTHELVRHRIGMSFSMLSQRFVDESACRFVVPPKLIDDVRNNTAAGKIWRNSVKDAHDDYQLLAGELAPLSSSSPGVTPAERTAARKAAREAARSVLPGCTETVIYVTGNGRSWRHFLDLRATPHADAEICRLALAVHRVLAGVSPNLFSDYSVVRPPAGGDHLATEWGGV